MQKIHKGKTPKVYKNKKLNKANFGTYNLNDYQVFLQLISKIGKVDINGTYTQPTDLEREHTLTAKEFSKQFNVELDGAYTTLKRVAKKLTETSITLEKPELFETWHIALCGQSKYNHKEGSLTVRFTEEIMPYLSQVKEKFVLYNLKEISNFGSIYSTRLYELIQEFKDTGLMIKSVAQLRDIFIVGEKFPLYGNFKAKTFAHAVEEINSQYEINLSFEEIKEGRKVVAVQFEFKPTFTSKGYNPATKAMVNVTVKPKRKNQEQQELPNLEFKRIVKQAKEEASEQDTVSIAHEEHINQYIEQEQNISEIQGLEHHKEQLINDALDLMSECIALEDGTHPNQEELDKDKKITELEKRLEEKSKQVQELIIEIPKRKKFFGIF